MEPLFTCARCDAQTDRPIPGIDADDIDVILCPDCATEVADEPDPEPMTDEEWEPFAEALGLEDK